MEKNNNSDPLKRRICITAVIFTLAVLAVIFALIQHQRSSIAPVYEMKVSGLTANTPNEAQAQCRAQSQKFAEIKQKYRGVCWVWCGNENLYLVKSSAAELMADSEFEGFTEISFRDRRGSTHDGYIISIDAEAKELGRIELEPADEYDFERVSMSIREGLRSGSIAFENAVYLWEKGSAEVLAVRDGSFEIMEENIAAFLDDGGRERVCYILDTGI